ncbi:MAG: hypothetical protein AMXMBFR13_11830 [Phycisphaerae bacterium]
MSASGFNEEDRLLEAYLDGLLSPADRLAFEQKLEGDAALRALVDTQKAMDASLIRSFQPPPPAQLLERIQPAMPAQAPPVAASRRFLGRFRELAVAAVVALLIAGGWLGWTVWRESAGTDGDLQPWRSVVAVYRQEAGREFQADWECPPEEFAFTFSYRFGQPLLLAALPPGVESRGLAYTNTLTPMTVYHVAVVDGQGVLTFVDRAQAVGDAPTVPPDSGLRVFQRQLGDLVLYEVTPLDQARLLQLFYVPKPGATRPAEGAELPSLPG